MKAVHFQKHLVRYTYQYNPCAPLIQTLPLIDDRTNDVTPFTIKREYLKARLHFSHLQRKQQQQQQHGLLPKFRSQNLQQHS